MIDFRFKLLTIVAICLFCSQLIADSGDKALSIFEQFVKELKNLQGSFQEKLLDENGEIITSSSGKFYIKLPRQFRWDYLEPYQQKIIANDSVIWLYDIDLEQVTIKQIDDQLNQSPLAIFNDVNNIKAQYELTLLETESSEINKLCFTPKQTGDYQRIELVIKNYELAHMALFDVYGQQSQLEFSMVRRNQQNVNDQLFQFQIPEGVDVVGDVDWMTNLDE